MHDEYDFDRWEVEDRGDAVVVHFTGDPLPLNEESAQSLNGPLSDVAARAGPRRLVLDLSNVAYASSDGLSLLLRLHRVMRSAGGSLTVRNPPDLVHEVLEVTRLVTVLEVRRG